MDPVKTWSYAVTPGDQLSDRFPLAHFAGGAYHLRVYGPNGFYREFKGSAQDPDVRVNAKYTRAGALSLVFEASQPLDVTIEDHGYGQNNKNFKLEKGGAVDLDTMQGWYDVSVRIGDYEARFAGRVENGKDSISDPVMGGYSPAK
jgi:phospholipase C